MTLYLRRLVVNAHFLLLAIVVGLGLPLMLIDSMNPARLQDAFSQGQAAISMRLTGVAR
jgi:hypothetical protein